MADAPPPPPGGGGGGVSLSFAKRARPKVAIAEADDAGVTRELITGVQGGVLEPAEPRPSGAAGGSGAPRVIPALPDTFKVGGGRRFNPDRYVPEPAAATAGDGADRFEAAGPEEAQTGVSYGLQTRQKNDAPSSSAAPPPPPLSAALPVATRAWEEARYKEDVAALPPEPSADAYEATPVEAFGEALLRGMGWAGTDADKEGPQAVRRPALLGLGAAAAAGPPPPRRLRKPGEDPPPPAAPAAATAAASAPTLAPGARVRVVGGRHAGLAAEVVAVTPHPRARGGARVRVALLPSEAEATLDAADVEVGSKERGGRREADGDARPRRDESSRKRHRSRSPRPPSSSRHHRPRSPSPPWLIPGIVVRVVSKRVAGGSLYLRRATIVDVPAPGTATLAPHDESAEGTGGSRSRPLAAAVTGVPQRALETALPRRAGGPVRVVRGPHAGRAGVMLAKGEAAAAVQLAGELDVVKLPLDAVAERVGGDDE